MAATRVKSSKSSLSEQSSNKPLVQNPPNSIPLQNEEIPPTDSKTANSKEISTPQWDRNSQSALHSEEPYIPNIEDKRLLNNDSLKISLSTNAACPVYLSNSSEIPTINIDPGVNNQLMLDAAIGGLNLPSTSRLI